MIRRPFVGMYGILFSVMLLFLGPLLPLQAMALSRTQAQSDRPKSVLPLHLLNTVTIPGTPASNWCYDVGTIDNGIYYLADNDQAGIDLIHDDNRPTYKGRVGKGDFTGIGGCKSGNYNTNGPEGLTVVHDQIFAGDGNSSVRVYSRETGKFITKIPTHGHLRTDEMAYNAYDQVVAVANGSERDFSKSTAPFLSFISTKEGKTKDQIIKTLIFPHANALEQPQWNSSNGKWYVTVPSSDQNPGGEVDEINPAIWTITPIATPRCEDAGLAFVNRELAAVGCASGDQIVLNLYTHQMTRIPVTSVDIVAVDEHYLFFASYGSASQSPQLAVTDLAGHLLQTIPTASTSHTVTVDKQTGHVFVPLDGGHVEIFKET